MKRLNGAILFAWWFMVSMPDGTVRAVGPFATHKQCDYTRAFILKEMPSSPCWSDGK